MKRMPVTENINLVVTVTLPSIKLEKSNAGSVGENSYDAKHAATYLHGENCIKMWSTHRGPKAASANYGLQVGMAHSGVSNTGLTQILLAANTPAPAASSMQATANIVSEHIIKTNKASMSKICEDLNDVQVARGHSHGAPINVEMNSRYNNPVHSGVNNTPFQAATQVTHLVAENVTTRKKIVAVTNKSKLCKVCANHRTSGTKPPPHKCSANLKQEDSIGDERRWARESLSNLQRDKVSVHIVTTDPDGKAFSTAQEIYLAGESSSPPVHQLDTRHITNNQRKKTQNTDFSKSMFGAKTVKRKDYLNKRFASDLSARCHAEHKAANYADADKVSRKIPAVQSAILKCYTGCHDLCRKDSFVCHGYSDDNWIKGNSYLPNAFKLGNPTDSDMNKFTACVNIRLGEATLSKTKYLLNTQKCEATNKAISSTAPRNMTFTKNYDARVHAAVHTVNEGIGESIVSECQDAGASLTPGTCVTRRLLKLQANSNKAKLSKKSPKAKANRYQKRKSLFELHENKKENNVYVKNANMPHNEH